MTARAPAALLAVLSLLAGCGGEGDDDSRPPPRPAETAHAVSALPDGWRVHVNRAGGFALGLPRGWTADDRRTSTLVRSFDRQLAISITPDRTRRALDLAPDEFATRALSALPGYEAGLEPGDVRPFDHRYRAAAVRAAATATQSGLDQWLEVVVMRRDDVAIVTAVIAAVDDPRSRTTRRLGERVVRTLRTRPPAVGSAAAEGPFPHR